MVRQFVFPVGRALVCGTVMMALAIGVVPRAAAFSADAIAAARPQQKTAPAPAARPAAPAPAAASEYVVELPGSKEYHRPGCELVRAAKAPAVLLRSQAEAKGLKPHADCDPANFDADGMPKPKPVYVYIQSSDNKYHKADCKLIGKEATRVLLDKDAVRGRWPCTVCRPPIRALPKPAR